MKKEIYIRDLKDGASIESLFIVTKIIKRVKKSQRIEIPDEEYCQVRLQDSSGVIDGIIWPEALKKSPDFNEEDYVAVKAAVSQFKGSPQLVINSLRIVPKSEIDPSCFVRSITEESRNKMVLEIKEMITGIKNPDLKKLLYSFFDDMEISEIFNMSAAAVRYHHAYSGGLLEHSLAVAKNCDLISQNYPELNRDLMVAGALLHDIGKIEEYKTGIIIKITDEGGLIGHIAIGYGMVLEKIKELPGFDKNIAKNILHIIISHHGYKEFGSPRVPETPEAFVVYHMDHMDADIFHEKFEVAEQDTASTENGLSDNDISPGHIYRKRKNPDYRQAQNPNQQKLSGF